MPANATIDVVYKAIDKLTAPVNKMTAATRSLESTTHKLSRSFSGVGSSILRMAGVAGIGYLIKKTIEWREELQNVRAQIGGILYSTSHYTGPNSLAASLKQGKQIVADLRKYSVSNAGYGSDYTSTFRRVSEFLRQSGISVKKIVTFTEKMVPASYTIGIEAQTAAMGITEMMEGRARITNSIVIPILKMMGQITHQTTMTTKEWNAFAKAHPEKAFELITKSLSKIGAASSVIGATMSNQLAGLITNIQDLSNKVLTPLFKKVNSQLLKINKWLATGNNKAKIITQLQKAGDSLLKAFEFIVAHKHLILRMVEGFVAFQVGAKLFATGSAVFGSIKALSVSMGVLTTSIVNIGTTLSAFVAGGYLLLAAAIGAAVGMVINSFINAEEASRNKSAEKGMRVFHKIQKLYGVDVARKAYITAKQNTPFRHFYPVKGYAAIRAQEIWGYLGRHFDYLLKAHKVSFPYLEKLYAHASYFGETQLEQEKSFYKIMKYKPPKNKIEVKIKVEHDRKYADKLAVSVFDSAGNRALTTAKGATVLL